MVSTMGGKHGPELLQLAINPQTFQDMVSTLFMPVPFMDEGIRKTTCWKNYAKSNQQQTGKNFL